MVRPGVVTRILTEADYPRWNALVARSPEGAVYSTPAYLELLCEAAGGTYRILAAEKGDEIVGGIALYERLSRFGTYVAPRLLLYYNGVVLRPFDTRYPSERTAHRNEILEALLHSLAHLGYGRIALRCRSPLNDVRVFLKRGWVATPHYSYVVPLADIEALRRRMEHNLRRLVERCERQGLTVTEDDDFDSFYRLHSQIHERKGVRLYLPEPAFQRYFERLRTKGLALLFHARLQDGTAISSQLVLTGDHPVSHTASAAADVAHLRLGATAFLRWNVFERLSRLGVAANDLTDASLNPVTHFKAQLGGDLEMCFLLQAPDSRAFRLERVGRTLGRSLSSRSRSLARRLGMRA